MKNWIILFAVGLVISGCSVNVRTKYDQQVDFKQYKTYFARFFVIPYYPIYDWIKWPYNDKIGMVVTPFDNGIIGNYNSFFGQTSKPRKESRSFEFNIEPIFFFRKRNGNLKRCL